MLRLPEIGALQLSEAELAYLSACSTANHGTRYADEVLHLGSAFHLAGFRHVIASLWPLDDTAAAAAERSFHKALPHSPVASDAAAVLRTVILSLRDEYPSRPDLWAPLIHSGPDRVRPVASSPVPRQYSPIVADQQLFAGYAALRYSLIRPGTRGAACPRSAPRTSSPVATERAS